MARLIDADALMRKCNCKRNCSDCDFYTDGDSWCKGEVFGITIMQMPTIDAVPVSELKKLRDYLYAEDLIFMRGLAELNKLIANCGAKMDGSSNEE